MSAQPGRKTSRYLDAAERMPEGGMIVAPDVSWEEYELLLDELGDRNRFRVSYDQGRLEIMSPSAKHEKYKDMLLRLADIIADELDCDLESFGSTTFKRASEEQGAEPDTSFYVQNAERVAGKDHIDLATDPPPDVIAEIDIARGSSGKLETYAGLGVPEVWQYDERKLRIRHLTEQGYVEAPVSRVFPFLTGDVLTRFLERSKTEKQRTVLKSFRQWVRAHRPKTP